MTDHERIWLQHPADVDPGTGRMWCEDKVWPDDPEDHEPIEYVRADIHAAEVERLERERDEFRWGFQHELRIKQELAGALKAAEARIAELEKALNQARLAFAGCVSVQSAVDMIDGLPTTRAALSTPDGWQSMETAPKDGTRFLALQGTRHFDCWMHHDRDGSWWMDDADSEPEPTHWRPLPAAPTQGGSE